MPTSSKWWRVPMRDGVELAATVLVPRASAAPRTPTILFRTPYRHAAEVMNKPLERDAVRRLVRSGYSIVIISDRGTQWSQGSYQC